MAAASTLKLSSLGPELEKAAGVFYVCPAVRYAFRHPDGSGRAEAPFEGIWFCGGWAVGTKLDKLHRVVGRAFANSADGEACGSVQATLSDLRQAGIVRSTDAELERQMRDPKKRERRETALRALEAKQKLIRI